MTRRPAAPDPAAPSPAPKHRFFLPPETLSGVPPNQNVGRRVLLPDDLSYQVRTVLRLAPGARVLLLDGAGFEYEAELVTVRSDQAAAMILDCRPAAGEPRLFLTLYAALLKGQHLEWVLQKGTELGISAFVPITTRRTVVRDGGRMHTKRARWERILREAAEQSHRGRVPRLHDLCSFEQACRAAVADHDRVFLPHVRHDAIGLADAARGGGERWALLIGPEGGFDESEVELALAHGIQVVSLGPRTLRAETASLAAATILLDLWGELGSQGDAA